MASSATGSAAFLVSMGAVLFSLMGLCVKKAHVYAHTSTFGLQIVRNGLGLLLSAGLACALAAAGRSETKGTRMPTSSHAVMWLSVRALGGFGCVTLEYLALQELPLAVNTMIVYSSPAFIVLWAAVLLGERVQWPVVVCLAVCFTGLLLIVEPWHHSPDGVPPWAYAAALVSSILAGLVYVSLRELKQVSYRIVLNVFMITCVVFSLGLGCAFRDLEMPPLDAAHSRAWMYLLGVALTAYAAEVCVTLGFARAKGKIGQVAVLKFLSPIASIFWGVLFLGEKPALHVLAGAALVLGASGCIVYNRGSAATGDGDEDDEACGTSSEAEDDESRSSESTESIAAAEHEDPAAQ